MSGPAGVFQGIIFSFCFTSKAKSSLFFYVTLYCLFSSQAYIKIYQGEDLPQPKTMLMVCADGAQI